MREVCAISVYSPDDPMESAIQDASHRYTGQWLPSYPCQLMARSVGVLKAFDDWLEDENLLSLRMSYFFSPHMTHHQEHMVFLTHTLFLRDIFENREINAYLHDPVTFVCTPLAHYLFHEFPVHIHVNTDILKSENPHIQFLTVGGLLIGDGQNVSVSEASLTRIVADESVQGIVNAIESQYGFDKRASIEKEPGVFHLDGHEREWGADVKVIHKKMRSEGFVTKIEPGETGLVFIEIDGETRSVPKMEFDIHYSLVRI